MELIFKDEVFHIIGAAIEVHKDLGNGFLEAVYQEAMEIEMASRNIPFLAQMPLKIRYKDRMLNKEYFPDLLCFDSIIVELKALNKLGGNEDAQLINYLKATGLHAGLLINFGSVGKLEWKKVVY
jgi:GxxExxY protein